METIYMEMASYRYSLAFSALQQVAGSVENKITEIFMKLLRADISSALGPGPGPGGGGGGNDGDPCLCRDYAVVIYTNPVT